jgi:D-alanyl-D-alanine carboxypeptidase
MKTRIVAAFIATAFTAVSVWAAAPIDTLGAKVVAAMPAGAGISLASVANDSSAVFVGGAPLSSLNTFRIASNTKVYVAATILRLWEDGKIKLDASIRGYVDPAYLAALDKDGYDTARITVRQLLAHTSGIADHTTTKKFDQVLETRPDTAWTRESQMDALVRWTDPIAPPGTKFYYSDDGYCLLGNIIERLTGKPLAAAVHGILDYEKLGLSATYWETQEPVAPQAGPRAHQIFEGGRDTYDWNPSLDMFGGGGLLATPLDMARFMADLFEGKVFKHPETLQLMISKEGLPAASPYRLGLFEYDAGGVKAYWHSGYWGTAAFYVPGEHRAYAFAVTRREGYKSAFEQMKAHIAASRAVRKVADAPD